MEETTNQEVVEDTEVSTLADNDGVTEPEAEYDDEGNLIEDEPEEEEEIELDDDLKLKLPKSQAEKARLALLRQADYTRKTQELAEERRAIQAERQALTQADEQVLNARANIAMIDRQIGQYESVDWSSAFDADPFEAQKAFAQYQLLKQGREQAVGYLDQVNRQRTESQQLEKARLVQEGAAELARDIPDWSPDLQRKLVDYGTKEWGMSKDDFDGVTDPRAVKLLHAAYQWHQHQAGQKKAQTIQKQQAVQPAASVGNKAPFPAGVHSDLPMAEFVRRRNAEEAKAGRR